MHDAMRRRQTTKEDQLSTMPHNGRIPAHGGGSTGTGSGIMEPHRHKQHHQLPRLSGAPPVMAPLSEASASGAGDGSSPSSSWVKRGCMMELARIAKIPQPASGLMCPRCRSTETNFCYYNNYSLSQPRHFCRTCRRYWTHGGALRDLSFPSSIRRRRGRNKSSNSNKHALSKLPCCASGGTGRASSPSSSGGRVQAAATATMPPLEQLLGSSAERHRPGASRLWFPGHSSQQDPVGYRYHYQYQLGNSIRLPCATSSVICRFSAGAAGGTEAASSFVGQMQAAISMAPAGSAALVTNTEPAVEMMAENPSLPEMMGTTLMTVSSLSGEFMVGLQGQGENDLFHFLGSGAGGSSWPACGGYGSAAGNGSGGEGGSCTAAPGNAWPDASGFTSSSSGRSTIL